MGGLQSIVKVTVNNGVTGVDITLDCEMTIEIRNIDLRKKSLSKNETKWLISLNNPELWQIKEYNFIIWLRN